jgi:hypothetical protein
VSSWDKNVYVWDLSGAYDADAAPWPTFQASSHRNGQIGFDVPTAVGEDWSAPDRPPARAALYQNYPNPFNPTTTLAFDVPVGEPQSVTLRVYDVTGALVSVVVDRVLPSGRYTFEWDGRDVQGNPVGSGVYFYRMEQGGFVATRKMVLLQ